MSVSEQKAVCHRTCVYNMAGLHHAIHARAMAYSLLLAYRHFSSLLSSVFLLPQNWFKKDLTIESLSFSLVLIRTASLSVLPLTMRVIRPLLTRLAADERY